jgi:hypothetical protein
MDHSSHPNNVEPVEASTPEEDPNLLAIEALEARTVDDDPKPLSAPRDIPVPPRTVPTPAPTPKVIEPIIAKPIPVVPKPVEPKPAPVITKPIVALPPAEVIPPKPKKPATTAEAIAEELAHAPATHGFQFFINRAAPRTPFVVGGIILVVVALGVGAYFILR